MPLYMSLPLAQLNFVCTTLTHAHPPALLQSGAPTLLSSRQPPHLTEGLSKILAEADVGELQHLAPFLTLAFPVSTTTCRAHKIGTMSYEARKSNCRQEPREEIPSVHLHEQAQARKTRPKWYLRLLAGGTKVLEPLTTRRSGRTNHSVC